MAGGLAGARDGVAAMGALGSEDFKTYFLGLLAATLRKGRPERAPPSTSSPRPSSPWSGRGERFYAAELHRQKGELLLAAGGDRGAAARCFETAVQMARRQRALALERRALQSFDNASGRPGRGE